MSLLSKKDRPPFQLLAGKREQPWVLLGDHAGSFFPVKTKQLSLSLADRERHITYDLGIKALLERLFILTGATILIGNYSRLVIDLNRPLSYADSVTLQSDGIPIPGNQHLTEINRRERQEEIFWPYHRAIEATLKNLLGHGLKPKIMSLHSFCCQLQGFEKRPWHAGVLWNKDDRLAGKLYNFLKQKTKWQIGNNQPYSGQDPCSFTLPFHAEPLDLPHVLLEIRQDMLESTAQVEDWALLLADFINEADPIN